MERAIVAEDNHPFYEDKKGDYRLRIFTDECPQDPRENDNLTTMICFHKRYKLGDEHKYKYDDFNNWEDLKNQILINHPDICCIRPLFLYDHGGITIALCPFDCLWDSGQIGWIYITKKAADESLTKPEQIMKDEVKDYDMYLQGNVCGFIIDKAEICDKCGHIEYEEENSCWGFVTSKPIVDIIKESGWKEYGNK